MGLRFTFREADSKVGSLDHGARIILWLKTTIRKYKKTTQSGVIKKSKVTLFAGWFSNVEFYISLIESNIWTLCWCDNLTKQSSLCHTDTHTYRPPQTPQPSSVLLKTTVLQSRGPWWRDIRIQGREKMGYFLKNTPCLSNCRRYSCCHLTCQSLLLSRKNAINFDRARTKTRGHTWRPGQLGLTFLSCLLCERRCEWSEHLASRIKASSLNFLEFPNVW